MIGEVVRDGLRLALAGVGAGLIIAFATASLVKSLLFGLTPHDLSTLTLAAVSLLVVALLACLVPAFRASHVDPMTALRTE